MRAGRAHRTFLAGLPSCIVKLAFLNASARSISCYVVALLFSCSSSPAAVIISSTAVDTPGLPGYKTFTVTANSDDPITAIDFVGDGNNDPATGRGFFGVMNQLQLPSGISFIFQDNNALLPFIFPGANAQQDSQFSVLASSVVVPPGLAEEAATILQAAWAWPTPQGLSVPFAQIVIPPTNTQGVAFRGAITAPVNGVQTDFPVSGIVGSGLPLPVITPVHLGEVIQSTPILANISIGPPSTWSGLTPVAGSPAIPATLTPQGQFSWNPTGSARGPKGNGVLYSWSATVTTAFGSTTGLVLTLSLIPEPATLAMCVIMITCFYEIRPRCRIRNSPCRAPFSGRG